MDIKVRSVQKADYDAVAGIMDQVQEMHVHWRPDIYRSNKNLISAEAFEKMAGGDTFYVGEADGRVVGVLGLVFRHVESPSHMTRDILFIDTMAVEEAYRGMGVGHAFFEFVQDLAKQKNCDGIELQVNARNKRAYEMYKKCGFREKSINMELDTGQ